MSSGAPIRTWRDLLLPNGQDMRVLLSQVDDIGAQYPPRTSTFAINEWSPNRLPSSAYLVKDMQSGMQAHLRDILTQHYANQVARTSFMNPSGASVTPGDALLQLREQIETYDFPLHYESELVSDSLSFLVIKIHRALTEKRLKFRSQVHARRRAVITDHVYQLSDGGKILWENKSPKVFDAFIGELVKKMRIHNSYLNLGASRKTRKRPKYQGYEAILSKLAYHASDADPIEPRIRWAIIFSGLHYLVVYMPRTPERPRLYCSPIMQFCLQPGSQPENATQLPIWSILEYMLLVESLNIDDATLGKRLGLPAPSEESGLGSRGNTRKQGKLLKTIDKSTSHPGKLTEAPGAMVVQCFDSQPIELKLVNAPHFRHGKKPFIHLDHYHGGGWSSVYASSKSRMIIKFAAVPKRDKAELELQLSTEKAAYQRLSRIAGWVVPRLYGEYRWFGGRALVLSDEGQSLSHLEKFGSLPLIKRLILFMELYCIHYLGVEHRDFVPRNVLRKKWSWLPKIIDFGFSNVNHTCPGWRECDELKDAWDELQLGGEDSQFGSWARWVKGRSYRLFLFITTIALTSLYYTN